MHICRYMLTCHHHYFAMVSPEIHVTIFCIKSTIFDAWNNFGEVFSYRRMCSSIHIWFSNLLLSQTCWCWQFPYRGTSLWHPNFHGSMFNLLTDHLWIDWPGVHGNWGLTVMLQYNVSLEVFTRKNIGNYVTFYFIWRESMPNWFERKTVRWHAQFNNQPCNIWLNHYCGNSMYKEQHSAKMHFFRIK